LSDHEKGSNVSLATLDTMRATARSLSLHGWALLSNTVYAADLVDNRLPETVAADQ
jgi:hypothetical protein